MGAFCLLCSVSAFLSSFELGSREHEAHAHTSQHLIIALRAGFRLKEGRFTSWKESPRLFHRFCIYFLLLLLLLLFPFFFLLPLHQYPALPPSFSPSFCLNIIKKLSFSQLNHPSTWLTFSIMYFFVTLVSFIIIMQAYTSFLRWTIIDWVVQEKKNSWALREIVFEEWNKI